MKDTAVEEIIKNLKGKPRNDAMPGNPRYQPKSMIQYFGFDNMVRFQIEVEFALWKVLAKLEVIPAGTAALLTQDLLNKLCEEITTSLQDAIERQITKHDIRALIRAIYVILDQLGAKLLAKWTHFSATSYDIIDTGRVIAYKQAFWNVSFPALLKLIAALRDKTSQFSGTLQIGRTHGQHGEPITVGFWLATVLNRLVDIAEHMEAREKELKGKFSGAMGAYNAQVALGLEEKAQEMYGKTFEEMVLSELGLEPAPISTQILPPEPLARFLLEYVLLSGALAQLANDCRQLQRSEIGEIFELYEETQDGSSAMAHKRNPIGAEGMIGIEKIVESKVDLITTALISEHQRDGTGMSVMREFPGIVVLVQHQLETLNRIISNISVDTIALKRNFDMNRHLILSEEVYLALIIAGYDEDAHSLVNHTLVPRAKASGRHLIDELILLAGKEKNEKLGAVVRNMPDDLIMLLRSPEDAIGKAKEKAEEIVRRANSFLERTYIQKCG